MEPTTAAYLGAEAAKTGSNVLNNILNIQSAKSQMHFQEKMSNTAHQREVKDLIKAGLNPILSVNSGASTPAGAMPSLDSVINTDGGTAASVAMKGVEKQLIKQQVATQLSNEKLNSAMEKKSVADTKNSEKQNELIAQEIITQKELAKVHSANSQAIRYENTGRRVDAEMYSKPVVGTLLRLADKFGLPSVKGLYRKKSNVPLERSFK